MAAPRFLDKLNPREQRLLFIAGGAIAVALLIGVPVAMEVTVAGRRADVRELRSTLADVQAARGKVNERKAKRDAIAARYQKRAPTLAGFLEQAASAQKLQVTDSVDRPEARHGKVYVERNTVIHLKKSGMGPIVKFLESLEQSGNAVAVTRLNIRKRTGEPDSFDVELGLSAYDRSEHETKEKQP